MPKRSEKTVIANRASAQKLKAKRQERLEHEELLHIRKNVSVELTEVDLEAIELRAEIKAMEKRREEFQSHNHAINVTIQEERNAPKSG